MLLLSALFIRNLQKAEHKLEKLVSALSEVDRKVAGLRDKFEKVNLHTILKLIQMLILKSSPVQTPVPVD